MGLRFGFCTLGFWGSTVWCSGLDQMFTVEGLMYQAYLHGMGFGLVYPKGRRTQIIGLDVPNIPI